jgi:hypothetical protein
MLGEWAACTEARIQRMAISVYKSITPGPRRPQANPKEPNLTLYPALGNFWGYEHGPHMPLLPLW